MSNDTNEPADEVSMLPAQVPVGWFVFDDISQVWVEVTGPPVTFCGITVLPVIDGYDMPLMFDEYEPIPACRAIRSQR